MVPESAKRLPREVAQRVRRAEEALGAIARGEDKTADAVAAADEAVRAAWAFADERDTGPSTPTKTLDEVIADRLGTLRKESRWSQAQLADAVAPYLGWSRQIVADVETHRRLLGLEELLTVAALFGEPVVTFLIPGDHTRVDLGYKAIPPPLVSELLIGRDGAIGVGGANWSAAARVASEPGRRPATDLWQERSTTSRPTRGSESVATTPRRKKGN